MPDEIELRIPTAEDRVHLRNIGLGALPDNPSQANYSAKEVKGAAMRPSLWLFDLLKNNAEYLEQEKTALEEAISAMLGDIEDLKEKKLHFEYADSVPSTMESNVVYVIPSENGDEYDLWAYNEDEDANYCLSYSPDGLVEEGVMNPPTSDAVYGFLSDRGLISVQSVTVANWDD